MSDNEGGWIHNADGRVERWVSVTSIEHLNAELIGLQDQATPWIPAATVWQSACLLCGARSPHVPERSMAHVDASDHYIDLHSQGDAPPG